MDDIVSSIRRILHGGEPAAEAAQPGAQPDDAASEVLILEPSMMIPTDETARPGAAIEDSVSETPAVPPAPNGAAPPLVAPETAAATASSLHGLMRTLVAERSTPVNRGGPTIEDLVREEIRPLLKAWLDAHLPALVERAVRAELERVIGRAEA